MELWTYIAGIVGWRNRELWLYLFLFIRQLIAADFAGILNVLFSSFDNVKDTVVFVLKNSFVYRTVIRFYIK